MDHLVSIGSIEDYPDALVSFEATRIRSPRVIWWDREGLVAATHTEWDEAEFGRQFGFAVESSPVFSGVDFDRSAHSTFGAERYGGSGVGGNGGGGRCGTRGGFQIKGIGINPLVGSDDQFHSYGGLGLVEAVAELVNSIVFGRILPAGTARCHGLIYTGPDTGYRYPPQADGQFARAPGALLIREACLRPAHFMRNLLFSGRASDGTRMPGDVGRIRRLNRQLASRLGTRPEIDRFLEHFLETCARQFAFAQVFRIQHGVISESNIALDGRWLDLTYLGFIDSGKNYSTVPCAASFHEEPITVVQMIDEFIHTFAKFNRIVIDIRPFVSFYAQRFDAASARYCARLLGFDEDEGGRFLEQPACREFMLWIMQQIRGRRDPVLGGPSDCTGDDPFSALLESLFASTAADGASPAGLLPARVADRFEALFEHCRARSSGARAGRCAFRTLAAIRALRKSHFSRIYYKIGAFALGETLAALPDPVMGRSLIDEYCEPSTWLFADDEAAPCVIYKTWQFHLSYDAASGDYCLARQGSQQLARFAHPKDLAEFVKALPANDLRILHFEGKPHLLRLLGSLARLEVSVRVSGRGRLAECAGTL